MLRSADFFDVAEYPTMRFLSTSVSSMSDGNLTVAGDLTIRGVTRRLEVPVTIRRAPQADAPTRFETTFEIDRTDFGLNGSPKYGGINVSVAKKGADSRGHCHGAPALDGFAVNSQLRNSTTPK